MEFGSVPTAESAGAILAHSIARPASIRFKKGRQLSESDAARLAHAGVEAITVCRLGPDDVHEDDASERLAAATAGDGLRRSAAFTGRVDLIAEADGLLVYDRAALDALNRVDEGITFAALPPFSRVVARQMAATAKIIPFGVAKAALEAALPAVPLFRVAPFQPLPLPLIQTVLDDTKPSVLDRTEEIMAARAGSVGATMRPPIRCRHEATALKTALEAALSASPAVVTVVGASAIVDRHDVIPTAIRACGGTVEHFGMPVDPGNLLLLGRIGAVPVIGAPGCVRSPKPNGYDRVLERLVAGVAVDGPGIMAMGAGGLLKEIPSRPLSRAGIEETPTGGASRIVGVLLAAGQSRRMGRRNKLLADLNGRPMVRHAAETLLKTALDGLTVVTGHQADAVRGALDGLPVAFADSPAHAQGLAETIKRGIAAVPDGVDGVLIALGDMPWLSAKTVNRLIAAFDPAAGRSICVPVHDGKRGNPVLFSRRFFSEIQGLSGDSGARSLLGAHAEQVAEVVVDDPGVGLDLDTPEALAAARADR